MSYNTVKLEKGLYNLSGKSFTQALAQLDPDENYSNTDMCGLDAYERQLKRFDIKVNGSDSDVIEKFFATTESAVLFPEFVKRAVKQGMDSSMLTSIVAAKTITSSIDYRAFTVSPGSISYSTAITSGAPIPETTINLASSLVNMSKFGRVISTTYEAIRQQRIDTFAVALKSVGAQISLAVSEQAVGVLLNDTSPITKVGASFAYVDLLKLWQNFSNYNLTTILASPATIAKIMAFTQMDHATDNFLATGTIRTPFGATIIKSTAVNDASLIGLDASCALEMVSSSDVILEIDKLMDKQIDRTTVTVTTGFSKIIPDATKVMSI